MNKTVDFFIVGAMKSGTSSVRNALTTHPQIDMYPHEAHFFSSDDKYFQGIDWYHSLFDFQSAKRLHGEKSPPYSVVDAAPERIKQYNPDAKIVWVFRSPVERAISHFFHAKKRDSDALSLEESIDRRDSLERRRATVAYVYRSQYEKHLQRYVDMFGAESNHVMIFEELIHNPLEKMHELQCFLEKIAPMELQLPHSNKSPKGIVKNYNIPTATVERLSSILHPTIEALEAHLGRPLSVWRKSYVSPPPK